MEKSKEGQMNFNEYVHKWCQREFNVKYADRVYDDLVDVAAGNRIGNRFENDALIRIKQEYTSAKRAWEMAREE